MFSPDQAREVFDHALRGGADFAELFLEDREDVSIDYNGGVSDAAHMRCYGAGLYLLRGTKGAYVYLNNLSEVTLRRAAEDALALMQAVPGGNTLSAPLRKLSRETPCPVALEPSGAGRSRC